VKKNSETERSAAGHASNRSNRMGPTSAGEHPISAAALHIRSGCNWSRASVASAAASETAISSHMSALNEIA
jgi:hypothetical protein